MERLVDTHYEHKPKIGTPAACCLSILHSEEQTIVVFTELPDNEGMSVTNAAEDIATQVRREFGLDPDQTRWIEHYPERQHHVHNRIHIEPATYDEVIYTWDGYQASEPTWRRLTREEFEVLVGGD